MAGRGKHAPVLKGKAAARAKKAERRAQKRALMEEMVEERITRVRMLWEARAERRVREGLPPIPDDELPSIDDPTKETIDDLDDLIMQLGG